MKIVQFAFVAALSFAPAALLAQSAGPTTSTTPDKHLTINQRKINQQDRIAQGVKSGELTAGETAHLEHQEAGINKEERGMRAQDSGHLTSQDRKTLQHQQTVESRRIFRDKHNGVKRG